MPQSFNSKTTNPNDTTEEQKPAEPVVSISTKKRGKTQLFNPRFKSLLPLLVGVMLLSFAMGLVGAGAYNRFIKNSPGSLIEQSKQVTLQENSATIDLVKKVGPSVVSITTSAEVQGFFGTSQQQKGAGTGIVMTADGLILTNKHVIEGADTVTVVTTEGRELKGRVIAKDPANDVAFIRVDATDLKPAEIGDSDKIEVGQKVVAIGNALGEYANTVTTGVISGKSRPVQASNGDGAVETLSNLFQTDAAINPGNSGGPLVNIEGQVIGINTAVAGGTAQNIGFAIPINEVKSALASVKDRGTIVRPYIGVRYVMISEGFAARNNLPFKEGALLRGDSETLSVLPNSPAAKAGLREGDILLKINDQSVTRTNTLVSVLSKYKVGETVTITFWRDGREQTAQLKLEEAPSSAQ